MMEIIKFFETIVAFQIMFNEFYLDGKLLIKDREYEEDYDNLLIFQDLKENQVITKKSYMFGVLRNVENWQILKPHRSGIPIRLKIYKH